MIKGEIILVEFPFTDNKGSKLRPALVLAEKIDDVLAAFITTGTDKMDEDDLLLQADDKNKLRHNSKLRLFRLATIEKKKIVGTIGYLENSIIQQIDKKLITILKINL